MKRRKLIIFSILVCLMFSFGFLMSNRNETHQSNQVNVVTESKEKEGQELEIVPIDDERRHGRSQKQNAALFKTG